MTLYPMIITAVVLAGTFYLFVRELLPPHITAMTAMVVLLATGVVPTSDVLGVFSNSAAVTIAAMCVLSAALERTGVIDSIGAYVTAAASRNRILAVFILLGGVMLLSAFMNNTPVVIVMAPVVIALARQLKDYPSKYLIPLSYAAILGGTCTLIGTSTNLLVDGVARTYGQAPFGIFEITGAGLCMAAAGAFFMCILGPRLLPERALVEDEFLDAATRMRFVAEAMIAHGSPLIGKTLNEVQFTATEDYEIIDLIRKDASTRNRLSSLMSAVRNALGQEDPAASASGTAERPRSTLRDIPLQAGDRLVFKTVKNELLQIRKHLGITFDTEDAHLAEPVGTHETTIAEGVIGPHSRFIGYRVSDLRLRRRYGCYILAIHRDKQNIAGNLEETTLRYGDLLLIEGPEEELARLFEHEEIMSLTQYTRRPLDRRHAPIAIATILGVAGLASFNVLPVEGLALIGVMIVILTGCITPDKAYESIEWPILLIIFGTLTLSLAMDRSGLARVAVESIAGLVQHLGPWAVLAIVYLVTSILTEIMSNNAAAVLLTPIAIALAQTMGVDPRPFIVAVMFGASASFATPIGYQTNTYVYNAGNYRFSDFLKIGVPMNLLMFAVAVAVIPLFWPFDAVK